MIWYTVSTIQAVKYKDLSEVQSTYPVYENYVLIKADDPEEAYKKAELHAKEVCLIDNDLRLNGLPAYMSYEGIRKVMEVSEPLDSGDDLEVKTLNTGVELSYSYMEVTDDKALSKLVDGRAVKVNYIDSDTM